jgi:hypothetical protein
VVKVPTLVGVKRQVILESEFTESTINRYMIPPKAMETVSKLLT